jgi:hypothetical protein
LLVDDRQKRGGGAIRRVPRMRVDFPEHTRPRRKLDERMWARFPGLMHFSVELALAAQDPAIVVVWAPDPNGRLPGDLVGEFHVYDGFRRV